MTINWSKIEGSGLSLLEALVSIIVPLAAAKNPAYSNVISAAGSAVNAELGSIAAGNAPTAHSLAPIAEAVVSGASVAISTNNPTIAPVVSQVAGAVANTLAAQ